MVHASSPPTAPSPASYRGHIPALDGLRALAILLVILHNSGHFGTQATGATWVLALVAGVGWLGVQLFFVLSGFLITGNLLDSRSASNYYSAFFARRTLRIFPLYYGALLVGLVILPYVFSIPPAESMPQADQVWLWTFLFNIAHPLGTHAYGFPHFWSLSVEEQFYLLWPFVVRRSDPSRLWKVCLWIMLAALVIRTALRWGGASAELVYEYTICRMDALAVGAALAAMLRMPACAEGVRRAGPWLLPAAGVLAVIGAFATWAYTRDDVRTQTFGHTILALVFAAALLAAVVEGGALNRWWQRLLSVAPLRSIGKYSYGMYVVHFPINLWLERWEPQLESTFGRYQADVYFVVVTTLTYGAAVISYHLLEKHFLRLKHRFVPRQAQARAQETLGNA